jgi:hypothetical protein
MRGIRASGSSQRLLRGFVLSNVCGSGDQGRERRFGTRSENCARSWIAGRQPIARRTFIGGYESFWRRLLHLVAIPRQLSETSIHERNADTARSYHPHPRSCDCWMPLGNRFLLWQDRAERDARCHHGLVSFRLCVRRTAALHLL